MCLLQLIGMIRVTSSAIRGRWGSIRCHLRRIRLSRAVMLRGVDEVIDTREVLLLWHRGTYCMWRCGVGLLVMGDPLRHWLLLVRDSGTLFLDGVCERSLSLRDSRLC